MGRLMVLLMALGLMATPVGAIAATQDRDELVLRREKDAAEVATLEDDDDTGNSGASNTGNTGNTGDGDSGTGNSNDGTNSRYTAVSRDRDRSVGDLTKDRTRDGGGDLKRDWTANHTNDRSRNDTR